MGLTGFNRARRERAKREAEALQAAAAEALQKEKPIEKLKKDELLALAAERGIEVAGDATKAVIIEALHAAEAEAGKDAESETDDDESESGAGTE